MTNWSPDASSYLEEYLARFNRPDTERDELRQHILEMAEAAAPVGTVTREHLLEVLLEQELQRRATAPTPLPETFATPVPMPPPLPQRATVLTHGSPAQVSGGGLSQGCLIVMVLLGAIFLFLVAAGFLAAIMLPMLAKSHEAAQRASCANNLRQLGIVLNMYASEHDYYPAMAREQGRLMMAPAQVYPDYVGDTSIYLCPVYSHDVSHDAETNVDDHSYVYFSHALPEPRDGLDWAQAYASLPRPAFDGNIVREEAPPLLRLRPKIPEMLLALGVDAKAEEIPVMLEWTEVHDPPGNHVLYYDGHVAYLHSSTGHYPNSQDFIEALWEIDGEE